MSTRRVSGALIGVLLMAVVPAIICSHSSVCGLGMWPEVHYNLTAAKSEWHFKDYYSRSARNHCLLSLPPLVLALSSLLQSSNKCVGYSRCPAARPQGPRACALNYFNGIMEQGPRSPPHDQSAPTNRGPTKYTYVGNALPIKYR